jgi:hydroxymethylbilane synthase
MNMVRAGTRGSPLALIQTREFLGLLGGGQEVVIATTGDAVQDRPLASIGGKGLFAKEIHEALLDGRIDCAVHSLKDLETELPPGIVLGCVLKREDPRDVLILPEPVADVGNDPLAVLPPGSVVGTSSVRRQAQLLHRRPDLTVTSIRGFLPCSTDRAARRSVHMHRCLLMARSTYRDSLRAGMAVSCCAAA